jgi:hypothetical protein
MTVTMLLENTVAAAERAAPKAEASIAAWRNP